MKVRVQLFAQVVNKMRCLRVFHPNIQSNFLATGQIGKLMFRMHG